MILMDRHKWDVACLFCFLFSFKYFEIKVFSTLSFLQALYKLEPANRRDLRFLLPASPMIDGKCNRPEDFSDPRIMNLRQVKEAMSHRQDDRISFKSDLRCGVGTREEKNSVLLKTFFILGTYALSIKV